MPEIEFLQAHETSAFSEVVHSPPTDIELEISSKTKSDLGTGRIKSANRLKYDAEVAIIKKNIGDLEMIRARLGLSARAMGHLLMADPSAWTRWTKGITPPPPHVYRMLEWYLILKDKIPWLATQYYEKSAQSQARFLSETHRQESERGRQIALENRQQMEKQSVGLESLQSEMERLQNQIQLLQSQTENLLQALGHWKIATAILGIMTGGSILGILVWRLFTRG